MVKRYLQNNVPCIVGSQRQNRGRTKIKDFDGYTKLFIFNQQNPAFLYLHGLHLLFVHPRVLI